MKMDYELRSKKNKAWGEIGYGIMWLFVVALIEGISYAEGLEGLFYHIMSIPAGIAAIYKFVIGFRKFKNINKTGMPAVGKQGRSKIRTHRRMTKFYC